MLQHKDQRVAVFIDTQNMYYSAKQLYKKKVNFKAILATAVAGRNLIRAIAYVIRADMKDEGNFHDALNNIGIEARAKDLQIFASGAKKGDWDVGIAMDMVRMAPKIDVAVLVSGDGDFKELLHYLKTNGVRCEVISFKKTTSQMLESEADLFTDMSKDLKKYLAASTEKRGRSGTRPAKEEPAADGTKDRAKPVAEPQKQQAPAQSPPRGGGQPDGRPGGRSRGRRGGQRRRPSHQPLKAPLSAPVKREPRPFPPDDDVTLADLD